MRSNFSFNGAMANKDIVPFALKMDWIGVKNNPLNQFNDYDVCALQSFSQVRVKFHLNKSRLYT